MAPTGAAVAAEIADDMTFARYKVADFNASDFCTNFDDSSTKFVARSDGKFYSFARPGIPGLNM